MVGVVGVMVNGGELGTPHLRTHYPPPTFCVSWVRFRISGVKILPIPGGTEVGSIEYFRIITKHE